MQFLAALVLQTLVAHAAPVAPSIDFYCLVLSGPGAPQGRVTLNYGEEKEIGTYKGTKYLVSFGDDLALENVLQLRTLKLDTKKQSVGVTILDGSVPKRIDLISEKGSVSCMKWEE